MKLTTISILVAALSVIIAAFGVLGTIVGGALKLGSVKGSFEEKLGSIDKSINNIETSLTNVDLKDMYDILINLKGGMPSSNSVTIDLKRADLNVTVSLMSMDDRTELEFVFDKEIEMRALNSMLGRDKELSRKEKEWFGEEPDVTMLSPRRLHFKVPSADIEQIAQWVPFVLKKLDTFCENLLSVEAEFDRKLEESLEENY